MYTEIAYQAIYGLRSGNAVSERSPPDAAVARRRVQQSKMLISGLLALVALAVPSLLGARVEHLAAPNLPPGLYESSVLAALLVVDMALVWWTGLQVLPTLLGARVQPLLETLPLDERTLDRAALLTTLRLFDAPCLSVLVMTPLVVGLAFHSPWAALAILPAAVAILLVAIALSLATGRFYVARILGSQGGTAHSVLRWAYLVLWTLPAFALFGFVTFSPQFFTALDNLYQHGPSTGLALLLSVFPFPLAMLPLLTPGQVAPEVNVLPILVDATAYLGLMIPLTAWLVGAPRAFTRSIAIDPSAPVAATHARLRTGAVALAIIRKDLRTASRTPGFALLILLPLFDAAAIGIWSFLGAPTSADVFNIGVAAVASSALLAAFFAPAFFAIEVFGYSYTRSLPIRRDHLLAGKIGLVIGIYAASSALVLGITAAALPTLYAANAFGFFAVAELPGVVAAALLEYGVLFWRAEKAGLPITNLYAGAGWVLAVSIPGIIVAGAPLAIFEYLRSAGPPGITLLPIMAVTGLLELVLVSPVAIRALGRGSV
jgi:predicted permease